MGFHRWLYVFWAFAQQAASLEGWNSLSPQLCCMQGGKEPASQPTVQTTAGRVPVCRAGAHPRAHPGLRQEGRSYKCQAECLVRLCPAGKRIARDREGWLQRNCGGFYSKQMNVVGGFSRLHYFCYQTLNCFIQHVTLPEEPENTTLKCLQLCQQAIML